jgi:hypothetical protein
MKDINSPLWWQTYSIYLYKRKLHNDRPCNLIFEPLKSYLSKKNSLTAVVYKSFCWVNSFPLTFSFSSLKMLAFLSFALWDKMSATFYKKR